ncbi:hypothetical protein B0H13DRAFT_1903396 [Mycena leptocephala]|nr:hypothetical protein B0H13DRAFT_1903396 [Mycena leptocephala]
MDSDTSPFPPAGLEQGISNQLVNSAQKWFLTFSLFCSVSMTRSSAIAKLFATLVFTSVSEHVVQMGFYHLENNVIIHRSDKNPLPVSTTRTPRPALSSSERQRSAFVFDPGQEPERTFNYLYPGSEARIKVQQTLPELQRLGRYEHVDALAPNSTTSGAICGTSLHLLAEKQQFMLERRVLALYEAGFSFDIIRTVLARRPTPYDVGRNVLNAARVHKGGDTHIQAARISSFPPSHTPENNLDPVLPFQISARKCSRSSPMPPVRSAGRKHHHKIARHEIKQSTENGSKREKRGDDVRRKYSVHLSAASHTGDYLAPEIQISTCNRFAGSPLPSMVKSKLRMSLELRTQYPAVLHTFGCSGATLPHLLSSYPSAHETEHGRFTVPPPTLMLPTSMPGCFQRPACSRPASRNYPEPFWGSEPSKNIVSNAVPVLSAGRRLSSLHPRSTCEGVPSPMLPDSNIAHPALPNYVNNVATLFPHRCSEISRISYATAQARARAVTVSEIETPNKTRFSTATLVDDNGLIFSQFPMQLVSFDSSRNSIMDMYAIDSFTLLDTIAPRTSPIFVPRDIYAAWAAHRVFATRFRDNVNHLPRWRKLVPDNKHTAYLISQLFMTYICAASAVTSSNSSLSLILNVAHSESAQSRYLISRTPVFKLCLSRAAAKMLGRTVQSSILLSATLSLPIPITDLSLLRHCTSRTNVVASRDHLFAHHWGLPKNSKSGPRAISRADVRGTRKEPAHHVNAPFMVQTQYNSESPEYISSVLEEVLLSIGSKSNSQFSVVTVTVDIMGAIGAADVQCNPMIWVCSEIIRVSSKYSAGAESWHRQRCNTLSWIITQYKLAKMAKNNYAKQRAAFYMPYKMGLTHHTREHSDDLRRGIESCRPRVSVNSGSVEDECSHYQRHDLFVGAMNYNILSHANYGRVRSGEVIPQPGDFEYKLNADCVPITTLLADSANEMSYRLLCSAVIARYGSILNKRAGATTILLPFHGASDVSHELGSGKIREKSEDTLEIVAYPTRFRRSTKSDREREWMGKFVMGV